MSLAVVRKNVIVKNKQGLHARPAALFVQVANKFDAKITVIREEEKVNGKSIVGILMLGAEQGTEIIIEAEGRDAQIAVDELEKIVLNQEDETV